jgi:hypothetical protein
MRTPGSFIRGLVLVSITSLPAFSTPITWQLVNVTGIDGATFTGSFVYDADTNKYSSINITATVGPVPGSDFAPATTFLFQDPCCSSTPSALLAIDSNAADLTNANVLDLEFVSALTDAGGTVALSNNSSGGSCQDSVCSSYFPYGEFYPVTGSVKASLSPITFTGPTNNISADVGAQVRYVTNLNIGDSYIDVTNTAVNGNNALGPGIGTTGNLCVNVYAFDPNEELVSCCSCLVTPDQTVSLSVNSNINNHSTEAGLTSLTIKLVAVNPLVVSASNPSLTNCTNAAAGFVNVLVGGALISTPTVVLETGIAAWGTTVHSGPTSGIFTETETPFIPFTLSASEATSIFGRCAAIIGNLSGKGICSSCKAGSVTVTGFGTGQDLKQ